MFSLIVGLMAITIKLLGIRIMRSSKFDIATHAQSAVGFYRNVTHTFEIAFLAWVSALKNRSGLLLQHAFDHLNDSVGVNGA